MTQDELKTLVGQAALQYVVPGEIVGVGTGSTVAYFIEALARIKDQIQGAVSSSEQSTALLKGHGIEVLDLNHTGGLSLYVDGADECDGNKNLIKGGGGAHLREKIVATASDRMVVIADQGKVVDRLGQFHLPVEVIPFGWQTTRKLITRALDALDLGQRPVLLRQRDNKPLLTDEGNLILDLALEAIPDPQALADRLSRIAGVVEHGLFLNICHVAIIGRPDGSVVELQREDFE